MGERRVVGITVAAPYMGQETVIVACDDGACFRLVRQWKPDATMPEDAWHAMLPVPGTPAARPHPEDGRSQP